MEAKIKPLVVKIGGSLEKSGRLGEILRLVARAARPVAVVPGGGVFADAVRETAERHNLNDPAAHRLAIRAMHQMARLMIELEPRLAAAESLAGMEASWREARVPVWLPLRLCAGDETLPVGWSVTSDSLAARLAERLGGAPLVLVKSRRAEPGADAATLAASGLVDAFFPRLAARAALDWRIVGPGEEAALALLLDAAPSPALPTLV